ncbi:MAG: hypothetical protein CMK49_00435 [Prochlorococcus sp. SP3034]|nr:hypothetical protein [Prochlorococcus sp. SP3034]
MINKFSSEKLFEEINKAIPDIKSRQALTKSFGLPSSIKINGIIRNISANKIFEDPKKMCKININY